MWSAERDGRYVAVKVFHDAVARKDFAEAIRREARLGELMADHPGVVAVQSVDTVGGALCLQMDWIKGPTLEQVLAGRLQAGRGPLPSSVAVAWIADVLRTLDDVTHLVAPDNPRSFVHRDIKPANLLLELSGQVRITDFGVAKAAVELGFETTATGIVKGSPRFMAPEVVLEQSPDDRADQFSAAAVLYELLTGMPLYQAGSLVRIIGMVTEARVGPQLDAMNVSPGLVAVLRTMLSRDRHGRYRNHAEAAAALEELRLDGPSVIHFLTDVLLHSASQQLDTAPARYSAEETMELPTDAEGPDFEDSAEMDETVLDAPRPANLAHLEQLFDPDDELGDDDETEVIEASKLVEKLQQDEKGTED